MSDSLSTYNARRKEGFRKDVSTENFLQEMNRLLQQHEASHYREVELNHPLIFIFGAPRSGTTLISQVLASGIDCGYINNVMSRFWLAPLHGIRLSRSIYGDLSEISFQSQYARTGGPLDIHEFGYFWRDLLNKETLDDVTFSAERENDIDWRRVQKVLANIVHEFDKPVIFKNIFGAYHLSRFRREMQKVIYVYIERDPLDTAVSILDARRKYYSDLNNWWSYAPLEVANLKEKDYWEQIAGQVVYLQRFYRRQVQEVCPDVSLLVKYDELCNNPRSVLQRVTDLAASAHGSELHLTDQLPDSFPFRAYHDRDQEKAKFAKLMEELSS